MKFKSILLTSLSLLLSSCATMDKWNQEIIKEKCNTAAAYNAGMTDGLTPKTLPNRDYASGYACPTDQAIINREYLKGFSEGIKSRPQEITINKNINVDK